MTAGTVTPYRPGQETGRDGFAQLVRAEWTKFRTVRGWVIGLVVAVLVMVGLGLFGAVGSSSSCQSTSGGPSRSGPACTASAPPVGPGGEAVNDSFYFVRQPLAGNGTITVRITSLTGARPDRAAAQVSEIRLYRSRGASSMTTAASPPGAAGAGRTPPCAYRSRRGTDRSAA